MAKCGMKMPREAAIGTVAGSGWERLLKSKDQLICNRFPTDSRRMFFRQILRRPRVLVSESTIFRQENFLN
jgi:hypothetical protein